MLEATNVTEAKKSILNVLEVNPLFTNKITNDLFILLQNIENYNKKYLLDTFTNEQILNLFVEIKTQYYYYIDVTQYNY
tara:strand:+ start:130 stop:366 length:237 start_codon:yes stop_codon:yes gene_type:complete